MNTQTVSNQNRVAKAKKRAWQDTLFALEKRDLLGIGWSLALASVVERECGVAVQTIMAYVHLGVWDQAIELCKKQLNKYKEV